FSRAEQNTVTDVDGNIYNIVEIGSQTWFAENLRTSNYNDNTPIPMVSEATEWSSLTTGAYSWFDNDSAIHEIPYGKMYNWYAVNSEKLCPAGWHVPVESEWLELANYLGGNVVAGGKLKSTGTIEDGTGLWEAPNDATNETGFSGLPGGRRYGNGSFEQKGMTGYWWSPQQDTPGYAFFWTLRSVTSGGGLYGGIQAFNEGMSIRCIKDK
ncbi:MAG: fibrobacter succinogenes major paralogous domain-containing protein, partial [Bacteroidales bacterium]|nr:fibrobacter succinogenes major paralogous domain-containing protein [Bacteroidales bacterium]